MLKKYTHLSELAIYSYSRFYVNEADANAIMMKFSKQLTILKLPIKTDFDKWVCGFDCPLHTFTINERSSTQNKLETLCRSHQRNFLKDLSISYHANFDPAPLNELSRLKKLRLFFSGMVEKPEIDINSILKSCSDNLTTLTLTCIDLKDELPMSHIFALRELKISSTSLPKQFDLFLSNCCPQLRSLTLDGCLSAGAYLNISNLSLLFLKINLIHPEIKTRPIWEQPKIFLLMVMPKTELLYYLDGYKDAYIMRGDSKEINHLLYRSCFSYQV
jgi:hypothetical protein